MSEIEYEEGEAEQEWNAAWYLESTPRTLPEGRIVVHNQVRPAAELGVRGFRAWTQPIGTPKRVVCDCNWASHLPEHYRVVLSEEAS